ncbi:hypothetical protein HZS_5151 [Henneguya salminicola]|nr:hypothetical protein HZS_5151 [Henneguya salminicola]
MSEKVEVPETPKSVTFENELKKELEEIENYQNLNENQKNLLEAICEFTTILKFDIWDENNHSSRGLKSLSTIMQLMDEQILEIFVNWFFKNSSVDLKIIAKHISTFTEDEQVLENPKSYENPNRVAFCFLICLLFHIRLLKKNQNNRAIVLCDILMDFLQRRSMDISPIFSAKICSLINRVYDILGRSHALIKFWFYMLNIHELLHYDESYVLILTFEFRQR